MTSWQALSPTPSVPKQRVSDGRNKVLSHWQVSREKKHSSGLTVSHCYCGWWMCLWPWPTWTMNITSFHWSYNLANYCSVLVQLCLRQTNMFSNFSRVEGLILFLTEAKGECPPSASLGDESWKTLTVVHSFSSFFVNSRKAMAKPFLSLLPLGYSYNHAIVTPMRQASTCGWILAQGPIPKAPNSGNQMVTLRVVSARSSLTKSKKTKIIERSNVKARVSVHWLAQCNAKWPRGGREFQNTARMEPMSLK